MRSHLLLLLLSVPAALSQDNLVYTYPHCDDKQVIVHLFEWSWSAIAEECENVLGPAGYCGVQISPPAEHIWEQGQWWIRYQHVSYNLESRSGTRDELADMVSRCAAVGVNIYADVVFNQMAGGSGTGSGGSTYDGGAMSYPAVPYSSLDFHASCNSDCTASCDIDYQNANSVRNCALLGMNDLDQSTDYVRETIAGYLNDLLSLGVMGFRVDASKHMWPGDLEAIVALLDDDKNGERPFVVHEVIDYGTEPIQMEEYFNSGKVTEFNYGSRLTDCLKGRRDWYCLDGFSSDFIDGLHALVFVDNHDSQRDGYVLTHNDGSCGYEYKLAMGYHLAHDYGFKRVMSSYYFSDRDEGPPDSYPAGDCGGSDSCAGGGAWVCEHRWPTIMNMVKFANAVVGEPIENYVVIGDAVGFSRGTKGFAVVGEANGDSFYTGMPDGTYCDVISDCAQSVTVSGGYGTFTKYSGSDPVVAICVGC